MMLPSDSILVYMSEELQKVIVQSLIHSTVCESGAQPLGLPSAFNGRFDVLDVVPDITHPRVVVLVKHLCHALCGVLFFCDMHTSTCTQTYFIHILLPRIVKVSEATFQNDAFSFAHPSVFQLPCRSYISILYIYI